MNFSTSFRGTLYLGLKNETGASRTVEVQGSEADIGLNFVTKGAGKASFNSSVIVGSRTSDGDGSNGEIYYNSTDHKFRGYVNGVWQDFGAGGGGGAPTTAQYLVLAADATLTQERVIEWESGVLQAADAGAGLAYSVSIVTNGINETKFRQSAALSIIGNSTNALANVADITAGADNQVLRRNGTTLEFALITESNITNNTISTTKLNQVSGLSILANATNLPANLTAISAGTDGFVLRRSGTTLGFGTIDDASITSLDYSKIINAPSGFTLTNGSGTTASTSSINLGGNLTTDVFINATASHYIMNLGSYQTDQLGGFEVYSQYIIIEDTDAGDISLISRRTPIDDNNYARIDIQANTVGAPAISVDGGLVANGFKGLKYNQDYTANFDSLSIIHKSVVISGTSGQIPFINTDATKLSYSSKFSWDNTNNRLLASSGSITDGIDNINFGSGTVLSGSWSLTNAEESTIRGTNSLSSGWTITVGNGTGSESGNSTFSFGTDNLNYGIGSYVGGIGARLLYVSVSQRGGFVHSMHSGTANGLKDPAIPYLTANDGAFNVSRNTVTQTEGHGALGKDSAILAGINGNIPTDSNGSVILGGEGIKARPTDPNQVYVPNFNIVNTPLNDDVLDHVLVRDLDTGQIKYRTSTSIGLQNSADQYQLTLSDGTNLINSGITVLPDGVVGILTDLTSGRPIYIDPTGTFGDGILFDPRGTSQSSVNISTSDYSFSGKDFSDNLILKTGASPFGVSPGNIYLIPGTQETADLKGNIGLFHDNLSVLSFGSGSGLIYISNATSNPTTNPTINGGVLYVDGADGSKLKWRVEATTYDLTGGISGLTTGRIAIASSATTLTDNAGLSYDSTNNALLVTLNNIRLHSTGSNSNLFLGRFCGNFTVTGIHNTGIGNTALFDLTSGEQNTAIGDASGSNITTGGRNTSIGYLSLFANQIGSDNTAVGQSALQVTTGERNTAVGSWALVTNKEGNDNTAIGYNALRIVDTGGQQNTAIGSGAGDNITSGDQNVIIGYGIDAQSATGNGQLSIQNIIFGLSNTAIGTAISTGFIGIGVTDPTATLDLAASTTSKASLRIRDGVAPTIPNEGDIWRDSTNVYIHIGGVTKTFSLV